MTSLIPQLYLASQSPRRRELLQLIGVQFQELKIDLDETPLPNELAIPYAQRLALAKAQMGWQSATRQFDLPVLGADTIVVLDNEILGKPRDKTHGIEMLSKLAGRTHQVVSAVAIVQAEKSAQALSVTEVTFNDLSLAAIETYWQSGEPLDKSGSYGLQGLAATFIKQLQGSPSGVMGLPLFETTQLLKQFGINILPT